MYRMKLILKLQPQLLVLGHRESIYTLSVLYLWSTPPDTIYTRSTYKGHSAGTLLAQTQYTHIYTIYIQRCIHVYIHIYSVCVCMYVYKGTALIMYHLVIFFSPVRGEISFAFIEHEPV